MLEDCLVPGALDDGDDGRGILRGNGEGPPLSDDSRVDVDVDTALSLLLRAIVANR